MSHDPRTRPASADGPQSVGECLALDALTARVRALDALDARLRRLLPDAIARESRLADVRNGRVVFLASSPAWATRLRQHESVLLAEARAAIGGGIGRVTVKVAHLPTVPPEPTRREPLPAPAAPLFEQAAKVQPDPEIRALFQRLASVARRLAGQDRGGS